MFSLMGHRKVNLLTLTSLGLLVIQNVGSVTLSHRVQSQPTEGNPGFEPLTLIILSELLKLTISTVCIGRSIFSIPLQETFLTLTRTLRASHEEAAVPALLYTAASFAQGVGARYLDLLPYLVLSQVKIVITPLVATILINQRFTLQHWFFLLMMVSGIVLAQVGSAAEKLATNQPMTLRNAVPGVVLMLFAGCCVAFGGIFMERLLKRSNSFFVRNAQLAAHSFVLAFLSFLWQSGSKLVLSFEGFNTMVWAFIILQALGGFLVAWCVETTSTVTKNYAQGLGFSLAVILPLLTSHGDINYQLVTGVILVLGAVLGSALSNNPKTIIATAHGLLKGDGI